MHIDVTGLHEERQPRAIRIGRCKPDAIAIGAGIALDHLPFRAAIGSLPPDGIFLRHQVNTGIYENLIGGFNIHFPQQVGQIVDGLFHPEPRVRRMSGSDRIQVADRGRVVDVVHERLIAQAEALADVPHVGIAPEEDAPFGGRAGTIHFHTRDLQIGLPE